MYAQILVTTRIIFLNLYKPNKPDDTVYNQTKIG